MYSLTMKGMGIFFIIMLLGLGVAFLWDSIPLVKTNVHAILDPTLGTLLNAHILFGFLTLAALLTFITTLFQKYTTDQQQLKELRQEQKLLQEEMKKYREHPEKMMELNQKSMAIIAKTMPLTLRPAMYTSIPFILLFRWFGDYFLAHPAKVLGMHWILAYFVFS